MRPAANVIKLGDRHCCACNQVCHHVNGPWFCDQHKPPTTIGTVPYPYPVPPPTPVPNLSLHACQIERRKDPHAYGDQYLIHCRCHDGNTWTIRQAGDEPYRCPVTGAAESGGAA